MFARALIVCAIAATVVLAANCGAPCSKPGGPSTGAADAHCGSNSQETNQASCHPADAGVAMDDGGIDYGDPMFGSEGDDDDCKYHVKWTVSDVCENNDTTFNLTLTKKADGSAATAANPDLEVFLDETHPAPNSGMKATDNGGGKYTVGPIRFDASGRWTVRFHFYEECEDLLEDSPHGHAAFYVDVP